MTVRSGQSITKVFTTHRFDTGAATNGDSTPSGTLYVNGTADAATVTVTNITTGVYKAAVTLPTLANGDVVDLRIAATVNSVSANGVIWQDTKDIATDSSYRPGIDWSNVGAPTTTLNLSGTTVKTATDVETDTADIQTRLPAALVGGRIDANTGAISGDSVAADNAEAFFDGTGYAGTNNVIPLVTTVTNLTNAATSGDLTATMKASVNAEADTALSDYGALKPTTAGRTLDVSAGGEAGIDLANVGSPTTTLNLSGTTISTSQTITTVSGAVGSVTGAVGSVTGNVGGNVTGSVGSLATQAKADVNAEVVDVLATDTYAEPGQGTPSATLSLAAKINYLFKAWRNKKTQTSSTYSLYADDASTVDQKATVSDDGTTTTIGEVATGP